MTLLLLLAAFLAASVTACTTVFEGVDDEAVRASPTLTSTVPETASTTEASTTSLEASDSTVERVDGQTDSTAADSWIGIDAMTDDRVDLVWAWSDDDEPEAYDIYRLEHGGASIGDLNLTSLDIADRVFANTDSAEPTTTFTDFNVVSGQFYTYVLVVPNDNTRRWTTALAVTDTEPPSPIVDLTGEWNDEGVFLSWEPSTDNVEFASYAVSMVGDDGETLTYIGGGADPTLANFHDPDPAAETVTYAIQAVDFHNNRTDPELITLARNP